MSWLSPSHPKGRGLPRRARERRRLRIELESLEARTVLSAVTASFNGPTSTLLIQGDTQNDNFVITENTDGSVVVSPGPLTVKPGVGVIAPSLINGASAPVATNNPVTTILVQLPGTNNFDIVNVVGQGPGASPTVGNLTVTANGANLTFNVGVLGQGVHNNGTLTVTDTAATPTDGVLNATINNSFFSSAKITQFGNGPDSSSVFMTGDTIPGPVGVTLGNANNDKIQLTNNVNFGNTTLVEGGGGPAIPAVSPANGTSSGNNDSISVTGPAAPGTSHYTTLVAKQDVTLAGGTHETININDIQVAKVAPLAPPPGVTTVQGNGAFDTTTVNLVTTFVNGPFQNPIPGTGYANISVTQGTGSNGLVVNPNGAVNDQASITNSNVPGFMSITQGDVASNSPMYNTALIANDVAGGALTIAQGNAGGTVIKGVPTPGDQATITGSTSGGNASISQGTGINDYATINTSTVHGNASITQADLAGNPGDSAYIVGDTTTGSDSIAQGNANNDVAVIQTGTAGGNATIGQGGGNNDSATIQLTSIGGNAGIVQGGGNNDLAQIRGTGTTAASGTIGGNATISQGGGNADEAAIVYETIGTAGTGNGNILITQGDGNGDIAEIETVVSTGGAVVNGTPSPIAIGITQGNGNGDIAAINQLTATGGAIGAPTSIFIVQGSGNGDWAEVANVNVPNASGVPGPAVANITITQNDVASNTSGDTAYVLNAFVGVLNADGSDNNGTGNVTIAQGDAPGDVALVAGGVVINGVDTNGTANNVTITQGSNGGVNGTLPGFDGSNIASDVAEVNDETVTSNIAITQGNANSYGYYVTAIGYDYLGYLNKYTVPSIPIPPFTPLAAPVTGSSSVVAGGITSINQSGTNNQVFLGDYSDYFYTSFLDVFTGGGGGALVVAQNTYTSGVIPLGPPFSSTFNVSGGGSGNAIYLDGVSSSYVTFDPATFSILF